MLTTNTAGVLHNSDGASTTLPQRHAHPERQPIGPNRPDTDLRSLPQFRVDLETAEHYRNLTRGLLCGPSGSKVLRIQSTHCEQKLWAQLLWQIPDQLLWDLACGRTVIVHDQSERDRETRAMWQGLQLVRIVTETSWFGDPAGRYHFGRGGTSAYQHLQAVAAALPRPVRKRFAYYRPYCAPHLKEARLFSCYRLGLHRHARVPL
ncbi:hypothetical protein O1R50_09125 [Glycomyces luteolus]|uniref:Uncharacterized protein n=1 Tax=Glycomyces luteolus TaxID=2670330 RepID=A0A9X3PA76_9ACTN|nr:hypothetical protein [Glycomyces luteolus]MDA1359783.1 hypothetical protein [Glycomyces luteolus]